MSSLKAGTGQRFVSEPVSKVLALNRRRRRSANRNYCRRSQSLTEPAAHAPLLPLLRARVQSLIGWTAVKG